MHASMPPPTDPAANRSVLPERKKDPWHRGLGKEGERKSRAERDERKAGEGPAHTCKIYLRLLSRFLLVFYHKLAWTLDKQIIELREANYRTRKYVARGTMNTIVLAI